MNLNPVERARLIEVITYHWMKPDASCGCGWAELGKSHPEHVVEIFEMEGIAEPTYRSYGFWTHNRFTDELLRDNERGTEMFIKKR